MPLSRCWRQSARLRTTTTGPLPSPSGPRPNISTAPRTRTSTPRQLSTCAGCWPAPATEPAEIARARGHGGRPWPSLASIDDSGPGLGLLGLGLLAGQLRRGRAPPPLLGDRRPAADGPAVGSALEPLLSAVQGGQAVTQALRDGVVHALSRQ